MATTFLSLMCVPGSMRKMLTIFLLSCTIYIIIILFKWRNFRSKNLSHSLQVLQLEKVMPEFEHKNLRKLNTFYCVHKILARNFSSRKFMENTFYNSHVIHCANDLEFRRPGFKCPQASYWVFWVRVSLEPLRIPGSWNGVDAPYFYY